MKHDLDNTGHPINHLLDPEETDMIVAMIQMTFLDFVCIYPSASAQEFPSKFEIN